MRERTNSVVLKSLAAAGVDTKNDATVKASTQEGPPAELSEQL